MIITCEMCEEKHQLLIKGETFGMTEGTDYNIHHFRCPFCSAKIILKTIIYHNQNSQEVIEEEYEEKR